MTNSYLQAGLQAVAQAGPIALEYFRKAMVVDDKSSGAFYDPITDADRRIEASIRETLSAQFPEHRIIGEEFGDTGSGNTYWIIDPIDGTRAFISGMPSWGVLLGLVINGAPSVGIMHQPFTGETFYGATGEGAFLNHQGLDTRLSVSPRKSLADAILYSTHPSMFTMSGLDEEYRRLASACRLQRFGGDCYGFALLAAGCIDLMVESLLQPYDIIPLIPIIEMAGGVVSDLEGKCPLEGGTVIAAANRELHQAALEILRGK